LLGQGSIDAQSSRPPVKEDDVDLERRRESAEKQKSVKDLEKKKEKKKNLERQALEKHRVKSRQKGESEQDSPDEDDGNEGDDDSDDSVGMAARLDRILKTRHEPMPILRWWGLPRSHQAALVTDNKRRRRRADPVSRLLLRPHGAGSFPDRNPLQRLEWATGLRPWRRGH